MSRNDSTVSDWVLMVQWHGSTKHPLDHYRDFCKGLLLLFFPYRSGRVLENEHISCIWQAERENLLLNQGVRVRVRWIILPPLQEESCHQIFPCSPGPYQLFGGKKTQPSLRRFNIISRSNLMLKHRVRNLFDDGYWHTPELTPTWTFLCLPCWWKLRRQLSPISPTQHLTMTFLYIKQLDVTAMSGISNRF